MDVIESFREALAGKSEAEQQRIIREASKLMMRDFLVFRYHVERVLAEVQRCQ